MHTFITVKCLHATENVLVMPSSVSPMERSFFIKTQLYYLTMSFTDEKYTLSALVYTYIMNKYAH